MARQSKDIALLESSIGDSDELEDVVFLEGDACILFSAKASTVPETVLKGGKSRAQVLEWYQRFFFMKPSGNRRGGAFRLLDKKVRKIRTGAESRVSKNCKIYPVVVTYDRLGCDNLGFYRWAEERCEQEQLLCDCAPPKVMGVEQFEEVMAVVASGRSLARILEGSTSDEWKYANFSTYLYDQIIDTSEELKMPGCIAELSDIADLVERRLFGSRAKSRSQ